MTPAPTIERRDLGAVQLLPGVRAEVVIACHNPDRPVARAVASVLEGNPEAAVTVVCHNRSAEEIAAALRPEHRAAVRYLEHTDPRPSASGPFNAGMRAARTEFVSIMGCDDRLAPGAVASWLRLADRTGAEFVIAHLALGTPRAHVPTPAPRLSRLLAPLLVAVGEAGCRGERERTSGGVLDAGRPGLGGQAGLRARIIGGWLAVADPVRDRLDYRSAPLGLISTALLREQGIALVEGALVGGDVEMMTRLLRRARTVYDSCGPVYLIGEDASDRVTMEPRPIREQLAFLEGVMAEARDYPEPDRRGLALKIARIHVFGAVHYRSEPGVWTPGDRQDLAQVCRDLARFAPGWEEDLSRAERDLLDACLDPGVAEEALIAASARRRRHGRTPTLLPRSVSRALAGAGPARLMAASLAARLMPGASDAWQPEDV